MMQSSRPSSHSITAVVPGLVISAVVVAPNVVMGGVDASGVVGSAVVVISVDEDEETGSVSD